VIVVLRGQSALLLVVGLSVATNAQELRRPVAAPPLTLKQTAYIKASNADAYDNLANGSGALFVFTRNGGAWTEQAFIKASNARPYNSFGVKLALSGDDSTLAVSAYLEDSAGQGIKAAETQPFLTVDHMDPWRDRHNQAEESGAVYLYTRTGTTWTPRVYVKGSNTRAGHEFGSAIAVSGDGRLMAVGAHNESSGARGINGNQLDTAAAGAGAVYVFTDR
jgi:FG-GAP repeat protein